VEESSGRHYSLVGDAELDEDAVWEAVLDPGVAELGEVVWIVDLNRQSRLIVYGSSRVTSAVSRMSRDERPTWMSKAPASARQAPFSSSQ